MAPSGTSPNPPVPGRLAGANLLIKTLAAGLTRLLTSPFKGRNGSPYYFKDVVYAALRTNLRNMSLAQVHYANIPTDTAYLTAAKAQKFEPDSITLPSGTKAHWVGGRDAKHTLLYLHGGGYVVPASPALFSYLYALKNVLGAAGHPVSILLLSYDLAPETPYPGQLAQAAELLSYTLSSLNRAPGDIILAGDSAGGNLTLSLLSHLLHPHPSPDVPRVEVSAPLRGALLISPWVSFNMGFPSFESNAEKDMFDGPTLNRWSRAFLNNKQQGDQYSEPLTATKEWWEGLQKVVSGVLVWGGADEILIDSIVEFAEKFKDGAGNAELVVTPREAHEQMIIDLILGYEYGQGDGAKTIENWFKAKL